jgi:hypothetical protein
VNWKREIKEKNPSKRKRKRRRREEKKRREELAAWSKVNIQYK